MSKKKDTFPKTLPILPLDNALLLPEGLLPLHLSDPQDIVLLQDALSADNLVGLVQPCDDEHWPCGASKLKKIGCCGKIVDHQSLDGEHHLITLLGKKRFQVQEELPPLRGYRQAQVLWLDEPENPLVFDRARLIPALRTYLDARQLECDWKALSSCPDDKLFTILSMVCPFTPYEQQSLLEADDAAERARRLIGLLELAQLDKQPSCQLN